MYDIIKGTRQAESEGAIIMLKKIFVLLFVLGIANIIGFASAQPSYVVPYYNGDRNYIFCGYQGYNNFYVNRASVVIEKDEYPEYIISVDLMEVKFSKNDSSIIRSTTRKFYYNKETEEMYIYIPWSDEWEYQKPGAYWEKDSRFARAGDIAFYIAYGEGFYSGSESLKEYVDKRPEKD